MVSRAVLQDGLRCRPDMTGRCPIRRPRPVARGRGFEPRPPVPESQGPGAAQYATAPGRSYKAVPIGIALPGLMPGKAKRLGRPTILLFPVGMLVQPFGDLIRDLLRLGRGDRLALV